MAPSLAGIGSGLLLGVAWALDGSQQTLKRQRDDGGSQEAAASSSSLAAAPSPSSAVAASGVAETADAPALSPEVLAELAALRKPLCDQSLSEEARASRCARGMQRLLAHSEASAMRAACAALGADTLPDEAVLCACQAAAQPDVSGRAAALFIGEVLRPRLAALQEAASRTLFAALLALLRVHARPLLHELLLPTLWHDGGALSGGQAEALSRLLKELPEALLGECLSAFLQGDGGVPSGWSEAQVALLQTALSRKPPLDGPCVAELVVQADANVDGLRKSLKFSSLLSTLLKTHGQQLRPHLPAVRRVAERLETFMRKSILAAVGKLEA